MTITPAKPEAVQKITLEQWVERAATWRKATKELVLLWFENELGTHRQLAEHLGIAQSTVTEHRKNLIAAGSLTGTINPKKQTRKSDRKPIKPVENSELVENSGSDGEVIEVSVSVDEPEKPAQQNEPPTEIMPTQDKPKTKKPKRPKEIVNMLDTHSKYIESRLLPIAAKVTELLKEIEIEANRLGGAWEKDNLVFSTSFQECVDYWNECERFDQFGETMNDSSIKTYAEVLEKIQLRLTRASQRMGTIQFSTGCIEEPNKRNLKLVS